MNVLNEKTLVQRINRKLDGERLKLCRYDSPSLNHFEVLQLSEVHPQQASASCWLGTCRVPVGFATRQEMLLRCI